MIPWDDFRFHHLRVAVADLHAAVPIYSKLFGHDCTSGPFDDPIQKVSVCFLSRGAGDMTLKAVAPLGADSPVRATLKKGASAYHMCYDVPDLDATIAHLSENECLTVSERTSGRGRLQGDRPVVALHGRGIIAAFHGGIPTVG